MFTELIDGKRSCVPLAMDPTPWDYIKGLLRESDFSVAQKANHMEYVMKGCRGKILVYVKFSSVFKSKIIILNTSEHTLAFTIDWGGRDYREIGEIVLEGVRESWSNL
jgi:hypothetical protein